MKAFFKTTLSLLFVLIINVLKAQTNNCGAPYNLDYNCSQSETSILTISSDHTQSAIYIDELPALGLSQPNREYWYRFVATANEINVTLDWISDSQILLTPFLEVYSFFELSTIVCDSPIKLASLYEQSQNPFFIITNPSLNLSGLTIGNPYYLRILDNNYNDPFSVQYYIKLCPVCDPNNTELSSANNLSNCDGSPIILDATPSNDVSYQWQLNGVDIPLADSSSYIASQTGSYSVLITPGDPGCAYSLDTLVYIGIPASITSPTGQISLCNGVLSNTLQAPTSSGLTYQWSNSAGIINGATNSSLTVTETGTYTVTINDGVCNPSSASVIVDQGNAPAPPLFSTLNGIYICNGTPVQLETLFLAGLTYQWTINGIDIQGATSSSFNATQPGNYCLKAIDVSGCYSVSSNCLNLYNDCVGIEMLSSSDILLYPNPASQLLTLEIPSNYRIGSIEILDMQGRTIHVQAYNSSNGKYQIPVSEISNGIYFISINTDQGNITKRFVKSE